jgi:sugar (pentulose or hexulose) kinase
VSGGPAGSSRAGPVDVGVDLGTTYVKAVVLDEAGEQVGASQTLTPWRVRDNVTYADADELAGCAATTIDRALAMAGDRPARALGATSMGESGVLLDARGQVTAPILAWFDTACAEQAANLARLVGPEEFRVRTGVPLDASRSVVMYAWLRRNVAGTARGTRWLSVAEWLLHWLGGRPATEASLGARTGFLELATGSPYAEVWRWAGAPAGLIAAPETAGRGLGTATRGGRLGAAVLALAGHDHLAAAHGAGARASGDVVVSCGTSTTVVRQAATTDARAVRQAIEAGLTVGPALQAGRFALQGGFMGGRQLDQARARLQLRLGSAAYDRCDEQAAALLVGPPDRRPSDDPGPHRPAAIWADAARQTWQHVEDIIIRSGACGPGTAARYIVCGGWTRSRAFRAAAEHGRLAPVTVRDLNEPGANGAAALAREASAQAARLGRLCRLRCMIAI